MEGEEGAGKKSILKSGFLLSCQVNFIMFLFKGLF
jgi:hypothetical protein